MDTTISFAKAVKEEISILEINDEAHIKALLSGFIKINSNLLLRSSGWVISIRSENYKSAKLIIKLLKQMYQIEPRVSITEQKRFNNVTETKSIHIEISQKSKLILEDLGIYNEEKGFDILPSYNMKDYELLKVYLRGCFLAGGSVNSPITKYYHLEIATPSNEHANYILKLLKKFSLDPKIITRRSQYVVYIKKSEQIADFLKLMDATMSLLNFEDVRIQRDQENSINRIMNCEISNEKKAMETGNEQAELIRKYKDMYGNKDLDPKIKMIAEIRLANPDANYNELADNFYELTGVRLTKSGIVYRMDKLMKKIKEVKL